MADTILILNAGSSSIKFQLFAVEADDGLRAIIIGQMDGIGSHARLRAKDDANEMLEDRLFDAGDIDDVPAALKYLQEWLAVRLDEMPIAVGHRVVHGGPVFSGPTTISDDVLVRLEALVSLAPLHQPNNLAPIHALRRAYPDLLQVACFDTAFHRGQSPVAERFAIPEALYEEGIRRYGFHGLSYEYIARTLPEVAPDIANRRVIIGHLGSGVSMCAIRNGRSVESTMGFTALDGLPMGTRSGQLDPGVVLYLAANKDMSDKAIEHLLYHECGLKGLSGISNDMRDLESSDAPRAKLAIDYFVYRLARECAALAAGMQGLDGLVFTAGIGENSPVIRARVCEAAAWLGVHLDPVANAQERGRISNARSRVGVYVVPTNEEWMIARHTLDLLRQG
ncbi:MAG: acetate/propionate family kinase [Pseudomonadota bacterium]